MSSTSFQDRFPPYVLTVVSQFNVILTKKRCCLSFCGLNSDSNHFLSCTCILKGLCVYACANCMQKECQVPEDAHNWCQIVFSFHWMFQNPVQNIEWQNLYRNFWGDRLELWLSISKSDKTRGPWATTLTWMYSYDGYIQPKYMYCKCCMQEKLTFRLPWKLIQFNSLD